MNTFSNKPMATATILGMALAASNGVVTANTLGTSIVELEFLKFTNDAGETFTNGVDLTILSVDNSSASNNATLNGVSESITGVSVGVGGTIDLPVTAPGGTFSPAGNDLCVGGSCPEPNNQFTSSIRSSANGDPTFNQAYADELLQGAAINLPPIIDPTTGVSVKSEATAMLSADGSSSAASENGLLATYDFIFTGTATHFNLEFDAKAYLESYRSPDLIFPGGDVASNASYEVTFKLENLSSGNVIFNWAPDGVVGNITTGTETLDDFNLNTTVGVDEFSILDADFVGAALGVANTGKFAAQSSAFLIGGDRYRITAAEKTSTIIRQQTNRIPEPASLALVGMGLIGFAASRKRKQS